MTKNPENAAQTIKRLNREMNNILRKSSISIRSTMRTTAIRSRMKLIKKLQVVIEKQGQA